MGELTRMSAAEIAAAIAGGEVSAVEVTQAHLDRIGAVDDKLHAFLYVDADGAMAQARAVDEALRNAPERDGDRFRVPRIAETGI